MTDRRRADDEPSSGSRGQDDRDDDPRGDGDDDARARIGFYDLEEQPEIRDGDFVRDEDISDAEDLLNDDMMKDYEEHRELDVLDPEMLDNREFEPITAAQRYAAEREIAKRRREDAIRQREKQQQQNDAERMSWYQRLPANIFMTEEEAEERQRREGEEEILAEDSLSQRESRVTRVEGTEAASGVGLVHKKRKLVYDQDYEDSSAVIFDLAQQQGLEDMDEVPVLDGLDRIPGTSLADHLAQVGPRQQVSLLFRRFLLTFCLKDMDKNDGDSNPDGGDSDDNGGGDDGGGGGSGAGGENKSNNGSKRARENSRPFYINVINKMCSANKRSLVVDFIHLSNVDYTLKIAEWCIDEPHAIIPVLDEAATTATFMLFPEYKHILSHDDSRNSRVGNIHVRFINLPHADPIPNLRQNHLNKLVKVIGVVTRRTSVYPQLVAVWFRCQICKGRFGPFTVTNSQIPPMQMCPRCAERTPFSVDTERTLFRNYQRITLQESPTMVKPGRLPRSKDVILLDDLVDSAKPGEEVEVIGVFKHVYDMNLHRSHGFPVFATLIEANNIIKHEDSIASSTLSPKDEREIRLLASDDRILERVAASIAPSIFGHSDIKMALALALFGGQTRILFDQGQHRIRGDINVLLLGDPGTAKSQFLKFVEKTSHRAIFTTGKGSTAVGLTAAVNKDPITREWTLEGGALVLADKGVCLIDEFDKMNDKDRTSIHEAMEQQSISISKAGIVTTLQARCAVIAAANPIHGRYDASVPFRSNVELTEPILSRFDILLVIRDIVNPIADSNLARFVVQSHIMSHPSYRQTHHNASQQSSGGAVDPTGDVNIIPQDLLRKYILYARNKLKIQWFNSSDFSKLSTIYADMRQEAERSGGFPICMRHVESAMRIAEACARIHLREQVRDSDLNLAIRIMLESFIGTHKFSVARLLYRRFHTYLTYRKDNNELLYNILQTLFREHAMYAEHRQRMHHEGGVVDDGEDGSSLSVDKEEFEARALEMNISECRTFYSSPLFIRNGFVLRGSTIVKTI